jgi:hypothetical protein
MLYTDTEVQAFDEWLGIGPNAAKHVLDKIAPAIAARALRDAADAMHKADPKPPFSTGWLAAELGLLARANHIGEGQS